MSHKKFSIHRAQISFGQWIVLCPFNSPFNWSFGRSIRKCTAYAYGANIINKDPHALLIMNHGDSSIWRHHTVFVNLSKTLDKYLFGIPHRPKTPAKRCLLYLSVFRSNFSYYFFSFCFYLRDSENNLLPVSVIWTAATFQFCKIKILLHSTKTKTKHPFQNFFQLRFILSFLDKHKTEEVFLEQT